MGRSKLTLLEFLIDSRIVTDRYIKVWGKWSIDDQLTKINEEDFEFKTATSRENELEEFWDCFFARLTLLHLKGYFDDDILNSGIDCYNKINQRSKDILTKNKNGET